MDHHQDINKQINYSTRVSVYFSAAVDDNKIKSAKYSVSSPLLLKTLNYHEFRHTSLIYTAAISSVYICRNKFVRWNTAIVY
jgi:hypothetical protein